MRNIKMIISYDGTNYHGWQTQKNEYTIQSVINNAIEQIVNHKIKLIAAGRTDAGVHAEHQVAHFHTESDIECASLNRAINSIVPEDIRIKDMVDTDLKFHSRFDAKRRTYTYTIDNNKIANAFSYRYKYFYPHDLDFELLKQIVAVFIGTHNFKAFCAAGSDRINKERTVFKFNVEKNVNEYFFTITANAFLYNMVRIIIGTILAVNRGKIKAESLPEILKNGARKDAGPTAPPNGLCLKYIEY